jgi:hypothetical protein
MREPRQRLALRVALEAERAEHNKEAQAAQRE